MWISKIILSHIKLLWSLNTLPSLKCCIAELLCTKQSHLLIAAWAPHNSMRKKKKLMWSHLNSAGSMLSLLCLHISPLHPHPASCFDRLKAVNVYLPPSCWLNSVLNCTEQILSQKEWVHSKKSLLIPYTCMCRANKAKKKTIYTHP